MIQGSGCLQKTAHTLATVFTALRCEDVVWRADGTISSFLTTLPCVDVTETIEVFGPLAFFTVAG